MSDKKPNTSAPAPKAPQPTRNPEGHWDKRTSEKNQQAGISPKK